MKRRSGLVSNSSSSSFLLFGWGGTAKEFIAHVKESGCNLEAVQKYADDYYEGDIDKIEDREVFEVIDHEGLSLTWGNPEGWEPCCYLGLSWDRVGQDETGGQFMEKIREAVGKAVGPKAMEECSTHEDAWHDG